jgi:predicted amidophosphoribosyltransferase
MLRVMAIEEPTLLDSGGGTVHQARHERTHLFGPVADKWRSPVASGICAGGWACICASLALATSFSLDTAGVHIRREVERGLAQWLGWRAAPAYRIARSWPSPWRDTWCRRCGAGGMHGASLVGCVQCAHRTLPWVGVARRGDWADFVDAIADLKYRRRWDIGQHLGRQLGEVIRVEHGALLGDAVAVIPVPMARVRRMQRGIDHAAVLAKAVASTLGLPMVQALRRSPGPVQAGQSRAKRLREQMPGLQCTKAGRALPKGTVVLIDDVRTTGQTATSVCQALGCRLVLLGVVAVSDGPNASRGQAGLGHWGNP